MKRVLTISVVAILVMLMSFGSVFAADDVVMDFTKGAASSTNTDDYVDANFEGAYGFFGPYWGDEEDALAVSADDGIILDLTKDNAWLTLEVSPQESAMTKYALVTAKTDDPSAINGFTMTFGTGPDASTGKDAKVGKLWADWGLEPLTTEYKTYVVDLAANGVTKVAAAKGPDFALNRGEATGGKIYVKSIVLSDSKDAAGSSNGTSGGSSNNDSNNNSNNNSNSSNTNNVLNNSSNNNSNNNAAQTTTKAVDNTDAKTGVEGIAFAVAAASLAVAGLVVSKKKIK